MSTPEPLSQQPPLSLPVRAGGGPRPKIVGVVPVVRWAILVKHKPRLTTADTEKVLAVIKAAWPRWKEKYRAAVAEKAHLSPDDLEIVEDEEVRLKYDGKTPMLDLPRIHTGLHVPNPFDLRNCAALCIDDYSSKIWTRLGLRVEVDQRIPPVGHLQSAVETFRLLAGSCAEWFYSEFSRLTTDVFSGIDSLRGATLEVTTVGLQVQGDYGDDDFDSWLVTSDDDGVESPNFENEDLCRFISEAGALSFHPRDLRSHEPNSFWLSMPSAIELSNGDLASRKVLYMVRPAGKVLQIVGIGLDDSGSGDLAGEAALKISRFVANRV